MDIQSIKIELAKLILEIENPSLIQKIKDILTKETSDLWTKLSAQEKSEIQLGIKQLNSGQRIALKISSKRFHEATGCIFISTC